MSDAPTPPRTDEDAAFRASLVKNLGGAVAVIVVAALAFTAIGAVGGDDDPVVADQPADATDADDPAVADDATEPPADLPLDEVDPADGEPDADPGTDAVDDVPEDGAEDDAPEDGAPEDGAEDDEPDEDTPDDDAPEEVERTVEPGEVTVQVLDGFKSDGGAAADVVADLLGGEGYDIIARNDALDYDVTTVLFNPGAEEAAEQIAAELGGAEVREQPGTLSDAVSLHVVVGADRG